ncbi:MAG: NAD(P)H-hydrate epimerase [Alkalispirochaeta sp.]
MQRLFMTEHGDPVSAVTGAEARQILTRLGRNGTPGTAEMVESAARSVLPVTQQICGTLSRDCRIGIVSGAGHTGAIGFALGRHLANFGVPVTVYAVSAGRSPEWERQLNAYRASSGVFGGGPDAFAADIAGETDDPAQREEFEILVDALLGGYVYGPPDSEVASFLNTLHLVTSQTPVPPDPIAVETSYRVLSLEIPSGVDPTTGVTGDAYVTADMTICFGFPRTGMSAGQCGSIAVADVGIPPEVFRREAVITYPCRFHGEGVIRLRNFG